MSFPIGVLVVSAIVASATEASTVTVREAVGNWVITSSQSWLGTEVPALTTHYNLFERINGRENYRASLSGKSQGDEGKSWETRYHFTQKGRGIAVEERIRILRPVWSLSKTGEIYFSSTTRRQLEWKEKEFRESSSKTVVGLVRGPKSEKILPVKISGEAGKILFYTYSHEFEVEFPDGRKEVVKPEAVKLGAAPN